MAPLTPLNSNLSIGGQSNSIFPFSALPLELQEFIFSFLPLVPLARNAEVSKEWKILSDSNNLWARFTARMGLSLDPMRNPRADYGHSQTAIDKNYFEIKTFPSWAKMAIPRGELLFIKYPEGIQVFNFRTKSSLSLNQHESLRIPSKMEVFSNLLLETIFEESNLVCNLFSTKTLKPLFSWNQKFNSNYFLDSAMSHTSLVLFSENKLVHAVDKDKTGQPAILMRSQERGNPVEKTFSHPFPVVFFQAEGDQRLISIDTESTLRIWDIYSGKQLKSVSLKLPASFEIEGGKPHISNNNGLFLFERYAINPTPFHLESIVMGPTGKIYLTFRHVELTCVAVFNEDGFPEDLFDGYLAFISPDKQFQLIQSEECVAGDIAPLNCQSVASYGRLWFVNDFDNMAHNELYDLKEGEILEDEVLAFFPLGDNVIYLKEDGVVYERDIYSTEIIRKYVRGEPYQADHNIIHLTETNLETGLISNSTPQRLPDDSYSTYIFSDRRLISANDEKIEIWDLGAETYTSFERLFVFPVTELLVRENMLYEVVQDVSDTKRIIIWNMVQGKVEVISGISDYSVLNNIIVTWDSKGTMSLWNLKGKHLRNVRRPYYSPQAHYFYFFGKDYVSYLGSKGRRLNSLQWGSPFYLEFPKLLQTAQSFVTDSKTEEGTNSEPNPKKRKVRDDDLLNHFEAEGN